MSVDFVLVFFLSKIFHEIVCSHGDAEFMYHHVSLHSSAIGMPLLPPRSLYPILPLLPSSTPIPPSLSTPRPSTLTLQPPPLMLITSTLVSSVIACPRTMLPRHRKLCHVSPSCGLYSCFKLVPHAMAIASYFDAFWIHECSSAPDTSCSYPTPYQLCLIQLVPRPHASNSCAGAMA